MKRTFVALSVACASAWAWADNPQFRTEWFSGIGPGATSISDMKATNGTWAFPQVEDVAAVANGALVLDLDADEEATFTVGNDLGETGTCRRVMVTGAFTPITKADLPSGAEMAQKEAQVGFAVVDEGAATNCYAWVGKTGSSESCDDWEKMASATVDGSPVCVTIELDYWKANVVTSTFHVVGATTVVEATTEDKKDFSFPLTGAALTSALKDRLVKSVSCTGSGTVQKLSGDYQHVVAKVGDTAYGTYDDAIKATTDGTIVKVRDADGNVTSTPTDTSKEVATDADGQVVVQTKQAILNEVKVGSASKGLMKDEAKFRAFLKAHCTTAYTKASATADEITSALGAEGGNKLALWQSYALGIKPDAALKLKQVAQDQATDGITLALPVVPSGDFTVKYTVGSGADSVTSTDPSAVKVPLKTGKYSVKVSFE